MRIPRVLLAAPASGGGKTTVTTGLLAALRAAGHTVAPFKVAPTTSIRAITAWRPDVRGETSTR